MKIGNNAVGNYAPIKNVSTVNITKIAKAEQNKEIISGSEKEYFSNLYPAEKSKIMQHHFYMKNGNMSGVMVGSLIDRRG